MNKEQIQKHEKMKEYILKRVLETEGHAVTDLTTIKEKVYIAIDFDRQFISYVDENKLSFTNDDEIDYIQERTGLEYSFVDMLLNFKYCFEMENDYWRYDSEPCVDCNSFELFLKEATDIGFLEKVVCKNCGCEMYISENGLEKI
jgi:hypothetical protein